MTITDADFAAHVASHAGLGAGKAERATEAILAAISEYLPAGDRQLIAEELPVRLGAMMRQATETHAPAIENHGLQGTAAGRAREVVASVCRVLAEVLSDDALEVLRRALPAPIVDLLVRSEPTVPEDHPSVAHRRDTLAEGRPGSQHPIDEARPTREHSESVGTPNPHADTKLSASAGTTQERDHETLAEGQPASRPVATTHE